MAGEIRIEKVKSTQSGRADREPPFHQGVLEVDGERVGTFVYTYHKKPVPFFFIRRIDVHPDKRGEGHGKAIMDFVQKNLLRGKRKMGILIDTIGLDVENDPRAEGMYERGGWEPIPDRPGWLSYNVPSSVAQDILSTIPVRLQASRAYRRK